VQLPSHPDADDTGSAPERRPQTSWVARIVIGIIVAAVLVVILLHLTGVVGPLAD
jgi:hypothetical protein